MAEFGAKDIQRLRQEAGVGMMDAKQALTDAGGDMERAFELLRERGQAQMAKRADREAKSDEFRQVADDIAMHVSWGRPTWVTREQVDEDALAKERELISRQAVAEGKPENVIDRIVEGRIESWFAENVLYDQKFVNAEKFDGTVGDMVAQLASKMGENISVRRVSRVAVGE